MTMGRSAKNIMIAMAAAARTPLLSRFAMRAS
jgi:hypothetical protein